MSLASDKLNCIIAEFGNTEMPRQKTVRPSQDRILDCLLDATRPLSLSEIAADVGIGPPAAYRHLQEMVRAGSVTRVEGAGAQPTYRAAPFAAFSWVDPETRLRMRWTVRDRVDWRFPLVSRVPDEPARRILTRLLSDANQRGIFHPWLLTGSAVPAHPSGITWVVYGSCARGEARPKSDLDLLVLVPPDLTMLPALQDLLDEANLESSRLLDARVVARDRLDELVDLLGAIRREGITVYSTVPGGEWIESPEAP